MKRFSVSDPSIICICLWMNSRMPLSNCNNPDIMNSNISEEEKIKRMIAQSTVEYDPSRYIKHRGMRRRVPARFICRRCNGAGHWIQNCPLYKIKRSTGIPRSLMVPVDGPERKRALLTASGHSAVPMINYLTYNGKNTEDANKEYQRPLLKPAPFTCPVCKGIIKEAMTKDCCGDSLCKDCVPQENECPICHKSI